MADDDNRDQRTEAPTPQRIQRALEEGQIGFSSELIGSILLIVAVLFFFLAGKWFFETMGLAIRERSTFFADAIREPKSILQIMKFEIVRVGIPVLALIMSLFLLALFSGFMQTRFNVTFKPLALKWDRLHPKQGLQRIFSSASLVRTALAVVKATIIVFIAWGIARWQEFEILYSGSFSFEHFMVMLATIVLYVSLAIAAVMVILGIIDLAFQKWKQYQDLRMSLQDIRDEMRQSEGDPHLRARIRQLQTEMSRNRMIEEVPKASVIITNPTHFAVAIQYDRNSMIAPVVLAKGKDHLALKIIEKAKENDVPVVERKPVARFLYHNVEISQQIPMEMYQAVAEILNYVNQIRRRAG